MAIELQNFTDIGGNTLYGQTNWDDYNTNTNTQTLIL